MKNDLTSEYWLGVTVGACGLYILQQTIGYARAFAAYLKAQERVLSPKEAQNRALRNEVLAVGVSIGCTVLSNYVPRYSGPYLLLFWVALASGLVGIWYFVLYWRCELA